MRTLLGFEPDDRDDSEKDDAKAKQTLKDIVEGDEAEFSTKPGGGGKPQEYDEKGRYEGDGGEGTGDFTIVTLGGGVPPVKSVEELGQVISDRLGRNVEINPLIDAMAVPGNPDVHIWWEEKHGILSVESASETASARRILDTKRNVIKHDSITVGEEHRGKGLGSKLFLDSVVGYRQAGIDEIRLIAGGRPLNGYYTWARFGVDADIYVGQFSKQQLDQLIGEASLRDIQTYMSVQSIMSLPGGKDFWKRNGVEFEGTFDLHDGSDSIRVFKEYMKEKGMPEEDTNFAKPKGRREYRAPEGFVPADEIEPLTEEDEAILDRIWEEIRSERKAMEAVTEEPE